MRALRAIIAVCIVLFMAVASYSAEGVKLRYDLSIYQDAKAGQLRYPEGIACDKSTIIVADTANDRLVKYTIQEKEAKGGEEIRVAQLSQPIRLQINSKGDIFALDGKQRRIVNLDRSGQFKAVVAIEGAPPPAVVPRSFKIDRDNLLYVLDIAGNRVIVCSPDGKFQRQIEIPKESGFASDLAVDLRGNILVLDSVYEQLYSAPKGASAFSALKTSFKEYLLFPVAISVDNRVTIFVTDGNGGAIAVLAPDGTFLGKQLSEGRNEASLFFPSQTCINEEGKIFVADRGNNRVQVFTVVR